MNFEEMMEAELARIEHKVRMEALMDFNEWLTGVPVGPVLWEPLGFWPLDGE